MIDDANSIATVEGSDLSYPIKDSIIDFLPDAEDRALHEIARVLKQDAIFSGCFYIKGKRLLTDIVVRTVLCAKGWFTAPFYNEQECLSTFGEYFTSRFAANLKSAFYFAMNKK